ncbi:MAG: UDP-N-acetylmuramoyl-L-alanine--D-glutamate ligase [Chloroflexota bacterium]|nr:MAG: UDP-N-acetylmuramoyl-L-alanine--D-glutamate ligase [Chloroflexota bacterium]
MLDELSGKRVVILGLARQGKALARFAVAAGADVVISDKRPADMLAPEVEEIADLSLETVLGDHPMSLLEDADVLAISGGVPADLPLVKAARERGIPITNDSHEFMKRIKAQVIGITGSAGKTTTTSLTGAMVRASGKRAWVGGNIGRPLISKLDQIRSGDVVVQELSSFQLEQWTVSPPIAAILNITANHLDRHKTMSAYAEAKANILRYQRPDDIAVLSADDAGADNLSSSVAGRLRRFSLELPVEDGAFVGQGKIWLRDADREWAVCDVDEIPLRGRHNVLNVLAAAVLADSAGITTDSIVRAIRGFEAVDHRLELVRILNGVQYFNDSIATSPERAIAALDSFVEPVILLAGGRDKEMVWDEWARRVGERVRVVVLFGELAERLAEMLAVKAPAGQDTPRVIRATGLAEAVDVAAVIAQPGEVVLLAPGGTSYDSYVDFAERGESFRRFVRAQPEQHSERTVQDENS